MAEAHDTDFVLSSRYTPGSVGKPPRYDLRLENKSEIALTDFALGVSGPTRIGNTIRGGKIVAQLSNWYEIAAPERFVLEPGAAWTVTAESDELDLQHWTDGVTGAMLILADRSVMVVTTRPATTTSSAALPRRGVMQHPTPAPTAPPYSIVPWPNSVEVSGRRSTPEGLAIVASEASGGKAAKSFQELTTHLFPGEGLARSAEEGGYKVVLRNTAKSPPDSYYIEFLLDGAVVDASTDAGTLYGLITLGQMVRGCRLEPRRFEFPVSGHILDGPQLGWRGCHLDVARRFYGVGEVAQFLRVMAWNKLNRFHWHLSDDEGWRLEIDAYPELTGIGAWRGYGLAIPPLLGTGPERTGGYYTKASVRELVALGGDLGIEIVPEIDVPGHCYALLAAMPQLKDPREDELYHSVQGFPNNCLNPGIEAVYDVIQTIFEEVCELFPSRYVHIGADEVPADAWRSSPRAQDLLAFVEGTSALQAVLTKRLQAFLTNRGKITGAWEEAASAGGIDRTNCYLVSWQSVDAAQTLAAKGFDIVVSSGQAYYLDMANGPNWSEPGAHWAGWSSPKNTYAFNPGAGWSTKERDHLLGVQACIWSEPMSDPGVFDRLVFPRLSAIAEAGWTASERRSWVRFSALAGLMPTLFGTNKA